MKCKIDKKHGKLFIAINSYDDFIALPFLIEPGDILTAIGKRKVKIENKVEVKFVKMSIKVEEIEYRINDCLAKGEIIFASDENISLHKHQVIRIGLRRRILVEKKRILNAQINLISLASKEKRILLFIYDIDTVKAYIVSSISKKLILEKNLPSTTEEAISVIKQYIEELKKNYPELELVIVGNSIINKELSDLHARFFTAPDADSALKFLIKIGIMQKLLTSLLSREQEMIEEFIQGIGKNWIAIKDIKDISNVRRALVTQKGFRENREIVEALDNVANVDFIIGDGSEVIDAFGGIVGEVNV